MAKEDMLKQPKVQQPKPESIPPMEWSRLLGGIVAFCLLVALLYFINELTILTAIGVFLAVSILLGLLANLKSLRASGLRMIAPVIAIIWLVINAIIGLLKVAIFMVSGFDSQHIVRKLSFVKFPEGAKPKRLIEKDWQGMEEFDIFLIIPFFGLGAVSGLMIGFSMSNFMYGFLGGAILVLIAYALAEGIPIDNPSSSQTHATLS